MWVRGWAWGEVRVDGVCLCGCMHEWGGGGEAVRRGPVHTAACVATGMREGHPAWSRRVPACCEPAGPRRLIDLPSAQPHVRPTPELQLAFPLWPPCPQVKAKKPVVVVLGFGWGAHALTKVRLEGDLRERKRVCMCPRVHVCVRACARVSRCMRVHVRVRVCRWLGAVCG